MRNTVALLLCVTAIVGCTRTLDPTDTAASSDDAGAEDLACVLTPTVLSDLDAVGATGRSAADILAEIEGEYRGVITWSDDGIPRYLGSLEPTPLVLALTHDGGALRSLAAELVRPCDHIGPCPCDDRFEIDVTLRVSSEDGVLGETLAATVVHQASAEEVESPLTLRVEVAPDAFDGSLSPASFAPGGETEIDAFALDVALGSGIATGAIQLTVASAGGAIGAGTAAAFTAARAVDDATCDAIADAVACEAVGCTPVIGRRLQGFAPDCVCEPPTPYCVASAPAEDAAPVLYTRAVSTGPERIDEVVLLPMLGATPPAPWRACADALEVDACACVDAPSLCP